MITTYIVENDKNQVLEYCTTLRQAKKISIKYPQSLITKIRGSYFGEGYHVYRLIFDGLNFKYVFNINRKRGIK